MPRSRGRAVVVLWASAHPFGKRMCALRLMSNLVAQSRVNPYVVLAIQLSKVWRKEGV